MRKLANLQDVSDGNLYDYDDVVCADTGGCNRCSVCCHHSGDLITLTPFDTYEITRATQLSYQELLKTHFTRYENNKIWLPHLSSNAQDGACNFLNASGRCEIHAHRPNICRLFPLGRVYENQDFHYFLQVNNCICKNLAPIKVKEWINISDYEANKAFLITWYQVLKALAFRLKFVHDPQEVQAINEILEMYFYATDLTHVDNFYNWFWAILPQAKSQLGIL
jgi:hypothetical protein